MSDYETIVIEKRGGVAWLTLNQPDSLNSMTMSMVDELRDFFGGLSDDRETRIVVMRGAGRAFCAGLNLQDGGANYDKIFSGGMSFLGRVVEIYIRMRRCPQPIISLVHGAACGGGFSLVMASDIRIAGESAKMNAAFILVGLAGCDMGSSYFLPRLVGTSVASELLLTGEFIHADRALSTNLVSAVVPDDQLERAAKRYIDKMLLASPIGLRMTKECLNQSIDADGLETAMAMENRTQLICSATNDAKEAALAFAEKRSPNYTDS